MGSEVLSEVRPRQASSKRKNSLDEAAALFREEGLGLLVFMSTQAGKSIMRAILHHTEGPCKIEPQYF
jgi:hypothetical protein